MIQKDINIEQYKTRKYENNLQAYLESISSVDTRTRHRSITTRPQTGAMPET